VATPSGVPPSSKEAATSYPGGQRASRCHVGRPVARTNHPVVSLAFLACCAHSFSFLPKPCRL
jgi:hypothetical protein